LDARGDFSEAERKYGEVLTENPSKPQAVAALNNLAWLLALHNSDVAKASDLITEAIRLTEPYTPAGLYDTRGVIHCLAGKADLAINDLEQAVRIRPTPSRLVHLAQAYLVADRLADAKEVWPIKSPSDIEPVKQTLHALEMKKFEETKITMEAMLPK
jgi:tetratricopeptide (TPR) repeat protein